MTPEEFLGFLWEERVVAIIRASTEEQARSAADAAIRGGFRAVEFTMTTPGVLELVAETADRPGIVVGAGTVLSTGDAREAVAAGAKFVVSPVMDETVIAQAAELKVTAVPGCHTPTEMWRAHRAGAPLVKLFPAAANGPDAVRSILGPMPFLRIVPTNGVREENVVEYLAAGAFAAGFVRALFDPADVAHGRWDAVAARARRMRELAHSVARSQPPLIA